MKFIIRRASALLSKEECPVDGAFIEGDDWYINIETLDELLIIRDLACDDLIIDRESIIIYDGYIE